ncbi:MULTISPECIES: sodium/proline symporter PutP [unclassified Bacillus (in: firmicutes)]|uniref:sodium/proline symporter PutP n=1 Tax=unclassified Bacillus (in: firmicutes) TaxID=185979 RepID=UPI0008E5E6B2|nr:MULTISPECIES: sodium/proline symporter PutP [unclassified Bacillus (in: firmicutes)]SFB23340.1 sodium/proline symporter [Bacillus sp. UNCCL13]SFQ87722.1 sodium/proline symporter [Bacillus sp. cl95]
MTNEMYQLISIGIYMVGMLLIGWYAYRKTSNLTDYMLGGRSLGPAVTALSAGAADMSGWLLMGLPGGIYVSGLADAWIAVGLTIGAYLNWLLVAPRLRSYTQVANDSITIPSYLENRFKDNTKLLRIVSGIVILVFFTFYVSSGMVSGAVFFESSFGTNYYTGLFIVSGVVVAYTLFGGFLAVSYTDFIQGLMMVVALLLVPAIGIFKTGGPAETFDTIRMVDPTLLDFFKGTTLIGTISAMAWGLGYFGQPHIIVRFMAINTVKETKSARRIGMGWMIFSLLGTIFTALVGIAFFAKHTNYTLENPEAIFIELGQILFHPLFAGFLLAAVLAAVMSTISSQLIVTSSALIEDLYKILLRKDAKDKELVFLGRMAVLVVSVVAGLLAMDQDSTILELVAYAWAGFGASFGPVILLSLFWRKMTNWGAVSGMIVGAVTVIVWKNYELGKALLGQDLYEIVPGFVLSLIVSIVVSLITYKPNADIEKDFNESLRLLKEE